MFSIRFLTCAFHAWAINPSKKIGPSLTWTLTLVSKRNSLDLQLTKKLSITVYSTVVIEGRNYKIDNEDFTTEHSKQSGEQT